MNKTYKKVFNARRGKYVAVDETKTGHGQMGTCTVGGGVKPSAITAAVVGAVLAMGTSGAFAETIKKDTKLTAVETTYSDLTVQGDVVFTQKATFTKQTWVDIGVGGWWSKTGNEVVTPDVVFSSNSLQGLQDKFDAWASQNTVDKSVKYTFKSGVDSAVETSTPTTLTNVAGSTLSVTSSTILKNKANLVNEGTLNALGGINIDSTSKLDIGSRGVVSTTDITGSGVIQSAGTLIAGNITAKEITTTGESLTATGKVTVVSVGEIKGSITNGAGALMNLGSIEGSNITINNSSAGVADDKTTEENESVAGLTAGTVKLSGNSTITNNKGGTVSLKSIKDSSTAWKGLGSVGITHTTTSTVITNAGTMDVEEDVTANKLDNKEGAIFTAGSLVAENGRDPKNTEQPL